MISLTNIKNTSVGIQTELLNLFEKINEKNNQLNEREITLNKFEN